MIRCFTLSTALLCLASTALAQPGVLKKPVAPQKQPVQAPQATHMVTINVVVASVHHTQGKPVFSDKATGDELMDLVNDLKAADKLATYNRISAAALEGEKGMAQSGSTVPVVSGRSSFGGRGTTRSYSQTSVGTLVQTMCKVTGGTVIANLKLEESRLVPAPKAEGEEAEAEPPSTASLTIDTVVALTPGKASLVTLREAATGDKATTLVVLATAALTPAGDKAAKLRADDDKEVTVFYLKFTEADEVQRTIQKVMGGRVSIAVDARTNALIVQGDEKQVKEIEALLKVLDKALQNAPKKR